jgi:hypothetical protein
MKRTLCWLTIVLSGCTTFSGVYPYRAVTGDCACEEYQTTDARVGVQYAFSAEYSVREGVKTRITVVIRNNNRDTLDLSLGYVKVSSRNVPYRYNGRFLPLTIENIPPGQERTLTLSGVVLETKTADPWHAIAGEELSIMLKGMRIRGKTLAPQTVHFIPTNPKLS